MILGLLLEVTGVALHAFGAWPAGKCTLSNSLGPLVATAAVVGLIKLSNQEFIKLYKALQGIPKLHNALQGFTRPYIALKGLTRRCKALPGSGPYIRRAKGLGALIPNKAYRASEKLHTRGLGPYKKGPDGVDPYDAFQGR
jgi:hypothetical protein